MQTKQNTVAAMVPLFLVLFIDGMGLSLLFPVLNSIIVDPHSHFLAAHASTNTRELLYGVTIGIFMLCWFFGAAIMGDLSDITGRKKSLLICLIGTFFGYTLSAVAVSMKSLTWLIVGRIIAGLTAGSQPIAQAAIVDISSPEYKARNIGLILFFASLGFALGPLIGGALSNDEWVSWFNFSTPLYFAALLALINIALLHYSFHETFSRTDAINIQWHRAVHVFTSAFKRKDIRNLSLIFLVMMYGWSNFFNFIPMFTLYEYQFTPMQTAYYMATMGIGFAVGCGFLVNTLTRHFSLSKVIFYNLIVCAISTVLILKLHNLIVSYAGILVVSTAIAVAYSAILTYFSNMVNEKEQGWVMGVTGSISALCFTFTAISTSLLTTYSIMLPLSLAAAGMLLSGILSWLISPAKTN